MQNMNCKMFNEDVRVFNWSFCNEHFAFCIRSKSETA
jgi:hypothetical protein